MKCVIFFGTNSFDTVKCFNEYMAGKPLTKDVIIHSLPLPPHDTYGEGLVIVVYFDEQLHPQWVGKDDTET